MSNLCIINRPSSKRLSATLGGKLSSGASFLTEYNAATSATNSLNDIPVVPIELDAESRLVFILYC